jgi:hypothetical protein
VGKVDSLVSSFDRNDLSEQWFQPFQRPLQQSTQLLANERFTELLLEDGVDQDPAVRFVRASHEPSSLHAVGLASDLGFASITDGIAPRGGGGGWLDPGDPFGPPDPGKPRPAEPPWYFTDQMKRRWESEHGPKFDPVKDRLWSFSETEATADQRLKSLDTDIAARFERYSRLLGTATDPKMQSFYRDALVAMASDLGELRNATGLTKDQKIELYNRIAYEAAIESKYNVTIITDADAKPFTLTDLSDLDAALSKLPAKETIENDRLTVIEKVKSVAVRDGAHAGQFSGDTNLIKIADSASTYGIVGETAVHEIGHSRQPSEEDMKQFMAISGWQFIGSQSDPRLAEYSNGDWAQAKELRDHGVDVGEAGDDQWFNIAKNNGNLFIVPAKAPPDISDKFVSRYATTNPGEDFAETYMFYYLHRADMQKNFPDKFKFMEEHFGTEGG